MSLNGAGIEVNLGTSQKTSKLKHAFLMFKIRWEGYFSFHFSFNDN
ncbi:hypothetical protein DOT_0388 [Desulfosporosinus sp. OT]|nr:hypothetical protein DOT_0388 [Desulfosporosinus sp. OT]